MYSPQASEVRRLAPRYAKAIDDLVAAVPLPETIPTMKAFEALADISPYFASEGSDAWKAHLAKYSLQDRSAESSRRRLWMFMGLARLKNLCLYCWMPGQMCMCKRILARCKPVQQAMMHPSSSTTSTSSRPQCKVTFIFHAEELFRMTNTAHIAAIAMDASFYVWGLPEHEQAIWQLGRYWEKNPCPPGGLWPVINSEAGQKGKDRRRTDESGNSAAKATEDPYAQDDERELSVLLYPAVGASVPFNDLLSLKADRIAKLNEGEGHPSSASTTVSVPAPPPLHIYLSDGTWNQARVVNRQVSSHMPRVALDISSRYEAMFHSLRKRTREGGVSTLEATAIAVSQTISHDIANGSFDLSEDDRREVAATSSATAATSDVAHDQVNNGQPCSIPSSVATFENSLFNLMREFVDIVSIASTKNNAIENKTGLTDAEVEEVVAGRNAYKVDMQKAHEAGQVAVTVDSVRHMLPAPVTNYCYVCDLTIGFERMVPHVAGKEHQRKWTLKPNFDPTEASKTKVNTYSLPHKRERSSPTEQ